MHKHFKEKVADIVAGKLTGDEIEALIGFFRHAMTQGLNNEEDDFFRDLAHEMSGEVKELALMIIKFRKGLKEKIHPEVTEIATKYIPQTTDQLEGIIETTEMASNKIMDNLENMRSEISEMKRAMDALREGKIVSSKGEQERSAGEIDPQAVEALCPLIDRMESHIKNEKGLISDSFIQMSFQDLTGQRIRRIMGLVDKMEKRLMGMVFSFGIKLTEKDKNPGVSDQDLQRAVDDKLFTLSGPQKAGQGLDQANIDELLATL